MGKPRTCMWTGEGEIEIETAIRDRAAHVLVAGDVDLATAPLLEAAVRAVAVAHGDVTLDVRHVAFIDAAGLAALRRSRLVAATVGSGFALLMDPAGPVAQMIERTRTGRSLRDVAALAA
jgi:anti-anti-sigma factor